MIVCNAIRTQLPRLTITNPIIIHYNFYEPDKQRDKGNIFSFADKVFQDALQKCGVIKNDGWKEIENFTHDFYVDKKNPRIEIFLDNVVLADFVDQDRDTILAHVRWREMKKLHRAPQ